MAGGLTSTTSYFDTTIGVAFFNVAPPAVPELANVVVEARNRRHDSPQEREAYIHTALAMLDRLHYPLVTHEWGHTLQAITHPALYLRCLREMSLLWGVVEALRQDPHDISAQFAVDERSGAQLSMPISRLRVSIDGGQPSITDADSEWPVPEDLSEADLLEDSASVFQYKAEIGGEGTARSYRRWLREGYRYSRTFDFLSGAMSPADAYVALPALVMAAYRTNLPLHTFAWLLALTVGEEPSEPNVRPSELGMEPYWEHLELVLAQVLAAAPAMDPRRSILEEEAHHRIDRAGMLELSAGMPIHPLSPLVERAWRDEEDIARLQRAMLRPYLAFDRRERSAQRWLEPFRPPVIALRILSEGIELGDSVLAISPTVARSQLLQRGVGWQEYLIELMRMKAFVSANVMPFGGSVRHCCPHRECPFHRHDVCRGWTDIPSSGFQDCNFPDWLFGSFKRRVDFDSGMLVRIE